MRKKEMKIRIEFKLEDFWIGIFWKKNFDRYTDIKKEYPYTSIYIRYQIWICVVPCFPVHITTQWNLFTPNMLEQ